jgi:hypothetical protein
MLFDFPAIESDRGYAMRAETQWTELLTCPNCGQSKPVHLSQPEGRVKAEDRGNAGNDWAGFPEHHTG